MQLVYKNAIVKLDEYDDVGLIKLHTIKSK